MVTWARTWVAATLIGVAAAALVSACSIVPPVPQTPSPPAPTPSPPAPVVPVQPEPAPSPSPTPTHAPTVTKIVTDISDATIGVIGVRTKATFVVTAEGLKLTYKWQHRPNKKAKWTTIPKATSAKYTAKASVWANGTQFRVIVTGTKGKAISSTATLTVLKPTKTPAKDAEKAFGLSGLRQGVDLSAYQYEPTNMVDLRAIRAWTGKSGFALLRTGSGDRPIDYEYTDLCTGKSAKTKNYPATRDCGYGALAKAAAKARLPLGHYWFNGWISSIDTTDDQLFAGGFTPAESARFFVTWLKRYGRYTKSSTDPLVLDIEDGTTRTKVKDGTSYRLKLRHWTPDEAMEFLTAVNTMLTQDGYHANLYVYMNAKTASELDENGTYAWAGVAGIARLWVAAWGTDNARVPDTQPAVGPWASHGGWSIWQYSSRAPIGGANVNGIDVNIAKADAWTPR